MINRTFLFSVFFSFLYSIPGSVQSQTKDSSNQFVVLEYNVENLFDCQHDSLKDDREYLPDSKLNWTPSKYWKKLNAVARGVVLSGCTNVVKAPNAANQESAYSMNLTQTFLPPSIIGLCEIENDSVMVALTQRSLLKGARYKYVMTDSPDKRGVDVALMYSPFAFQLRAYHSLRIDTLPGMRPTRDILYVKGGVKVSEAAGQGCRNNYDKQVNIADMHVFVVHAPSRSGGEAATRAFRMCVAKKLVAAVDSINNIEQDPFIIVMGDFNDYSDDASLVYLGEHGLKEISAGCKGISNKDVKGTYRYRGKWDSLDHILASESLVKFFQTCAVVDHPELLEEDKKYGGFHPNRYFLGPTTKDGYSDHLPLVATFGF